MSRNNSHNLNYVKITGSVLFLPFVCRCADFVLSVSLLLDRVNGLRWQSWLPWAHPSPLCPSPDIVPLCGSLDYCIAIVVVLLLLVVVWFRAATNNYFCFLFIWGLFSRWTDWLFGLYIVRKWWDIFSGQTIYNPKTFNLVS